MRAVDSAIPAPELDFLRLNEHHAWNLAQAGRGADGYTRLLNGLTRAQGDSLAGYAWSPRLQSFWEAAIRNYCEEFCLV